MFLFHRRLTGLVLVLDLLRKAGVDLTRPEAIESARAQSSDEPADEEAEPIEVIVYRMPEN